MYCVTVTLTLTAGSRPDALPLIEANARTSRMQEPGCRQFDVCTDPDAPETVFLYELYDDRAAFDAHLQSAHFREFDANMASMTADKTVRCFPEVRT